MRRPHPWREKGISTNKCGERLPKKKNEEFQDATANSGPRPPTPQNLLNWAVLLVFLGNIGKRPKTPEI